MGFKITDSIKGFAKKCFEENGLEAASKMRSEVGDAIRLMGKGETKEQEEDRTKQEKTNIDDER